MSHAQQPECRESFLEGSLPPPPLHPAESGLIFLPLAYTVSFGSNMVRCTFCKCLQRMEKDESWSVNPMSISHLTLHHTVITGESEEIFLNVGWKPGPRTREDRRHSCFLLLGCEDLWRGLLEVEIAPVFQSLPKLYSKVFDSLSVSRYTSNMISRSTTIHCCSQISCVGRGFGDFKKWGTEAGIWKNYGGPNDKYLKLT